MFKVKIKVKFTITRHVILRDLMDSGYHRLDGMPLQSVYNYLNKMPCYAMACYMITPYDEKFIRLFLPNILLRNDNHFELEPMESSLRQPTSMHSFSPYGKCLTSQETNLVFNIGIEHPYERQLATVNIKMDLSLIYNRAYKIRIGELPDNVKEIDNLFTSILCMKLYFSNNLFRGEILIDDYYKKLSRHQNTTLRRHFW